MGCKGNWKLNRGADTNPATEENEERGKGKSKVKAVDRSKFMVITKMLIGKRKTA